MSKDVKNGLFIRMGVGGEERESFKSYLGEEKGSRTLLFVDTRLQKYNLFYLNGYHHHHSHSSLYLTAPKSRHTSRWQAEHPNLLCAVVARASPQVKAMASFQGHFRCHRVNMKNSQENFSAQHLIHSSK